MTSGRLVAIAIVAVTALFAAVLWYAQTRAYFETLDQADLSVTMATGEQAGLVHFDFQGIDAASSPLRFRGCFTLDAAGLALATKAARHPDPTPLIAPDWFTCFDAERLTADLVAGAATAVMSMPEIHRGVDRVIAVYPDGRAYVWHQLNGSLD